MMKVKDVLNSFKGNNNSVYCIINFIDDNSNLHEIRGKAETIKLLYGEQEIMQFKIDGCNTLNIILKDNLVKTPVNQESNGQYFTRTCLTEDEIKERLCVAYNFSSEAANKILKAAMLNQVFVDNFHNYIIMFQNSINRFAVTALVKDDSDANLILIKNNNYEDEMIWISKMLKDNEVI